MRALLDLAAPIRCVSCGDDADGDLCRSCAERIAVITPPMCARCGAPSTREEEECVQCLALTGFRRARSVVVFAEPARSLTLSLKRRGARGMADAMGSLMADAGSRAGLSGDTVTFVPGGRRARRAGFDQAELLARGVARSLRVPVKRYLFRAREGPRQADVPVTERRDNVRDRFSSRPVKGRVLLVDDVYTTGATAEACSNVLLQAGASSVDVITWARTLRRHR
jgi:ComF family protein